METVRTTTLIVDLENSDFELFEKYFKVIEYDIPQNILNEYKYQYGKYHMWIKEICGDIPYYYNSPNANQGLNNV